MEKIRNLSIKKTIILYMVISLLGSFLLSAIIVRLAEVTQQRIWLKYIDKEKYYEAVQGEGSNYMAAVPRVSRMDMNKPDGDISELCDFLETYSVLLLSVAGSCIAVVMFYRNKLKAPIEELGKASKLIAQDELDFNIAYQNQDELGELCRQFEKMRMQLAENNRAVWYMMEEEKALRAAIAHDIRSPLSVLRGYQEMLLEFVPEETLDKDKIIEMLQEGMSQIERMNSFIETMRKMTSLAERELQFRKIDLRTLGERIQKEARMICRDTGKDCTVRVKEPEQIFYKIGRAHV
jgi:signal transduction histidine kinase